jgi:hypothetical protein
MAWPGNTTDEKNDITVTAKMNMAAITAMLRGVFVMKRCRLVSGSVN